MAGHQNDFSGDQSPILLQQIAVHWPSENEMSVLIWLAYL
jgi:hypothetical protein